MCIFNRIGRTKRYAWIKPLLTVAVAVTLAAALATVACAAAAQEITATVGGVNIYVNRRPFLPTDANGTVVAPVVVDGTTFLPVRALSEAFGKTVAWDGASRTVTLSGEGEAARGAAADAAQAAPAETAVIAVEKGVTIVVDGETLSPTDAAGNPVEPFVYQGTTYLPVRAVSSALGQEISWDGATGSVYMGTQPRRLDEDGESPSPERTPRPNTDRNPDKNTDRTQDRNTERNPDGNTGGDTETDAGIPAGAYAFTELSPDDMQLLMSAESRELIRFRFEQSIFPALVLSAEPKLAADIRKKSSNASNWADDMWAANASIFISMLQEVSDDLYVRDESKLSDEKLVEGLKALIDRAGLSADNFFKTSFVDTAEDGVMLLLTFGDTSGFEACKYIGVVAMPDGKLFYFTAEADPDDAEHLNLCFINAKMHGTVAAIGYAESDFRDGVDAELGRLSAAGALTAPQEKAAPPEGLFMGNDRGGSSSKAT